MPVADNQMAGDGPTYRRLSQAIRDDLPAKGRKTDAITGPPKLPAELEGALRSLCGHYRQAFERWEQNAEEPSPRASCGGEQGETRTIAGDDLPELCTWIVRKAEAHGPC